mmetsp:Transcript_11809/g.28023  ORF Transcript_11809/g.28023 Transcript_11809/m.28023 type:complete len:259 (+) Transcript_11809:2061-2837(+)
MLCAVDEQGGIQAGSLVSGRDARGDEAFDHPPPASAVLHCGVVGLVDKVQRQASLRPRLPQCERLRGTTEVVHLLAEATLEQSRSRAAVGHGERRDNGILRRRGAGLCQIVLGTQDGHPLALGQSPRLEEVSAEGPASQPHAHQADGHRTKRHVLVGKVLAKQTFRVRPSEGAWDELPIPLPGIDVEHLIGRPHGEAIVHAAASRMAVGKAGHGDRLRLQEQLHRYGGVVGQRRSQLGIGTGRHDKVVLEAGLLLVLP